MNRLKKVLVTCMIKGFKWLKRQESILNKSEFEGCIIIGEKSNVKIGDSVSFGGNVILFANSSIDIGEHTMIGINSLLHTSTHNYIQHPMWMERIDRPIRIGSHVWIGANVVVSPGVIIDDYAVIGAGSVVVANVPKFAIIAGNPARIINYRDKLLIGNKAKEEFTYPINAHVTKLHYLDEDCKNNL